MADSHGFCVTCRWFSVPDERLSEECDGECRRWSPQVVGVDDGASYVSEWPAVSALDWCGEWRGNE